MGEIEFMVDFYRDFEGWGGVGFFRRRSGILKCLYLYYFDKFISADKDYFMHISFLSVIIFVLIILQ